MLSKLGVVMLGLSIALPAAAQDGTPDPKDTEVWTPEPARVVPGSTSRAPSDALVLFDGKDAREWVSAAAPGKAAGWIVADLGRQPWAIEGVLPTAVAVSNLGIQTVLGTLIGFVVLYTILIVVEMKLMLKAIRKGPEAEPAHAQGAHSPLIGTTPAMRTAPMITAE